MHISTFRLENYKSFRATQEVKLMPGFNVIVGQNNAGKTALMEALSFGGGNKPHRSLKSAPTALTPVDATSKTRISFWVPPAELIALFKMISDLYVPLDDGEQAVTGLARFKAAVSNGATFEGVFHGGGLVSASVSEFTVRGRSNRTVFVRPGDSMDLHLVQPNEVSVQQHQQVDYALINVVKSWVYTFRAERFNVGVSRAGQSSDLAPNAANLPEVLAVLQGRNPTRFKRLTSLLSVVFPAIKDISVRPVGNDQVEIVTWTIDPDRERDDLAVPLNESGTGVGQVLAMLYVALNAAHPRVILIDEPNSFLHPGAVRKLFEILKQHGAQHQLVMTTHSPALLTASDPRTLLRLRIDDGESVIEELDVAAAKDLQLVLADVGARLSDVFGADSILWVEGRTEEESFPRILQRVKGRPLRGTAILGVLHTSDFEARRSEATVELYSRLSTARGLLPPAIGFIFDREGRNEKDRADLARRGNVFFLDRRMYENYLINPAALASVLNGLDGSRAAALTEAEVEAWLAAHRWEPRFFAGKPAQQSDDVWLREVRGEKVLAALFSDLSEQRVAYDKVRHGVALTDWMVEHAPAQLEEVALRITDALDQKPV